MKHSAPKTNPRNSMQNVRLCPFVFTGDSPSFGEKYPNLLIGYTISFRDRRIYVTTGGRCEGYITFGGTTKF